MTPTIITHDDNVFLVTGSPGGSTIINTVLQVIVNAIDHNMSIADAVGSPRFHHQWQPNIIRYETGAISNQTIDELRSMGPSRLIKVPLSLGRCKLNNAV